MFFVLRVDQVWAFAATCPLYTAIHGVFHKFLIIPLAQKDTSMLASGLWPPPRYTRFDQMESFPRLTVPQFYLQSLGAYVNPLCVSVHHI